MAENVNIDPTMLELFQAEVESHTGTLSEGLLLLEQEPASAQSLDTLMRASHSIKGAARMVGIEPAVKLAHAMEDCFVAAANGHITLGPDHVDVLLRSVDLLTQIGQLSADEQRSWPEQNEEHLSTLLATLADIQNGKTPPPLEPASTTADSQTGATAPEQEFPPVDESMLELFSTEVDSQVTVLNEGLLALEQAESLSETLESLMRAAHCVKGAARLVGLDNAIRIAHVMEDCFVAAQAGRLSLDAGAVDVLLRASDMLAKVGQVPAHEQQHWNTENQSDIDALTREIEQIGQPSATPTPSQPPQPVAGQSPEPAPSRPPADEGGGAGGQTDRVLRVSADRVNRLMGLAGEFTVSAGWVRQHADSMLALKRRQTELIGTVDRLRSVLEESSLSDLAHTLLHDVQNNSDELRQQLASRLSELEEFERKSSNLAGRLNYEVVGARMRPFQDGIHGFQRMVRDVARSLGKQVKLDVQGLDTQVDRDILDRIEAPLNHILRNAIDHGIETPEERRQAGKPETGTIRIEAVHSAGMLCINIVDDGRGVDLEKLRRRLVDGQLVSESMAQDLSETELLDFLFLPSFSTRDDVTEISGRGVGLDVVHSVVQEMRGHVRAHSELGKGLYIHLQLPLTLSVIRSLLVTIGGELYAFPLARLENILRLDRSAIETLEDRQYIAYEGRYLGLLDAARVLGKEGSRDHDEYLSVVVLGDRANSYGLVVDKFVGERDLAVHTLDPRLGKIKDISAAAVTEDGDVLLIIDVDDMLRSIETMVSGERLHKVQQIEDSTDRKAPRVLIVDDSLTVREVERKLLESRGYEVEIAVDGMDGWNTVRIGEYDLVISDIDMPRMNGFEFVGLIKNDPKLKALPVMIVSYKDRPEDRDRGLEVGADYYLAKGSFHDEKLVEAVVDLIGEAH